MRFYVFVAAIVVFIITALIAFFLDGSDFSLRSLVGLLAVGLGLLTLAFAPAPNHPA